MPIRASVCQEDNSVNVWLRDEVFAKDELFLKADIDKNIENVEIEENLFMKGYFDFLEISRSDASLNSFGLNTAEMNDDTINNYSNQIDVTDDLVIKIL